MLKLELEKLLEIGFRKFGVSLTDRLYGEDILRLAAIDDLVFKDGALDIDIYSKLVGDYCLTEFQLERDFDFIPFFRREIKDFNGYEFLYEVYVANGCGSCLSMVEANQTIMDGKIECFGITILPPSRCGFIYVGDSYIKGRNEAGYIGIEVTDDLFEFVVDMTFENPGIVMGLDAIRNLEGKNLILFEVVRTVMNFLND